MSKNKCLYVMTEKMFNRIVKKEKRIPTCYNCGKVLVPNSIVVSVSKYAKTISKLPKRYCFECKEKLNIWV